MTFDDWMILRNPKYHPTDDTVALRELRDCWRCAEYNSERAQERELMIELMRDKCRKVGVGETAGSAVLPTQTFRAANVGVEALDQFYKYGYDREQCYDALCDMRALMTANAKLTRGAQEVGECADGPTSRRALG